MYRKRADIRVVTAASAEPLLAAERALFARQKATWMPIRLAIPMLATFLVLAPITAALAQEPACSNMQAPPTRPDHFAERPSG
jgi:hypothetical protein